MPKEMIDPELLTVLMWILGGIGGIIVVLLGLIAYFLRENSDRINNTLEKHEGWILAQQKEISEIAKDTRVAIELIRVSQEQHFQGKKKRGG